MSHYIWGAAIGATAALCTGVLGTWIQYKRMRREFLLQTKAEEVAKELLSSERWQKRSFKAVQERIGGFGGDELRKILIAAGAVRFKAQDGEELWGLLSRNREAL